MIQCNCVCHGRFDHPCDVPGGCGHLHQADVLERPSAACRVCRPPRGTRPWKLAPSGYTACQHCVDDMTEQLTEIRQRYYLLNPRPGSCTGDMSGRGSPGFGSRSPASDHIVVMRDSRSSPVAHVWRGSDGRIHREATRPPLSVFGALLIEAVDTAERRRLSDTHEFGSVAGLVPFLTRHLDWWATQRDVGEFGAKLRVLVSQLRPVTGSPRPKPFARCPNTIDLGEHTRSCGGPIFPPESTSDVIQCSACGRPWDLAEWRQLGDLLRAA